MKIPHHALIALANGERFVLMRNVGQPFEPRLERVSELDLELTNFSAGAHQHEDPRGPRDGISPIDELAHGAAVAEWLNMQALRGGIEHLVIAADPKTLGQIRQHCHKELESRIVGEVAKDLTNSPTAAIEQALAAA
jgi:protein required for attachment to host cells